MTITIIIYNLCMDAVSPFGGVSVFPGTVNVSTGDMVEITCSTRGGPSNFFTYTRVLDQREIGNMSTISISISSSLDGGDYECAVTNSAGNGTDITTINGIS